MGQLIDGRWDTAWYDTDRQPAAPSAARTAGFRNWITADGAPGPSGEGGFAAESGRYHLYVSYACPWAHRTLIFRALKGLAPHIGVSVVHPDMLADGWTFATGLSRQRRATRSTACPSCATSTPGPIPDVSGRVTVPVLWDRERETIVSNESSEIIRMFNSAFDGLTGNTGDFWPDRPARRDRGGERPHLRHGEQRRLQGRLRHHAGRLRRGGGRRSSRRWTGWKSASPTTAG